MKPKGEGKQKVKPEPWAQAAFVLTVLGLIAALKNSAKAATGLAVAGIIALIAFKLAVSAKIERETHGAILAKMHIGLIGELVSLASGIYLFRTERQSHLTRPSF